MLFPGEKEAIAVTVALAEQYGYGNLICHLSAAWSKKLQGPPHGLPKNVADRAAFHPDAFTDEIVRLEKKVATLEQKLKAQTWRKK